MDLLNVLNEEQRIAVTKTLDKDTLLLAGPGSGKTMVLQTRYAYLLQNNISPKNIMAVTFTNKAANELKERITQYVGEKIINKLFIGTFHGTCIKLLHNCSKILGIKNNFTIADPKDCLTIINDIVDNMLIIGSKKEAERIAGVISDAKNNMILPDQFSIEYNDKNTAMIYEKYQSYLDRHNMMDFDDIILKTVNYLSNNSVFRELIQIQFKYIMIDEVQDTNTCQHNLIKLLAGNNNVFMVGDLDQSLYSWRAAKPEYFSGFLTNYPNGQVLELSQNYRSTKTIIQIADGVISQNPNRFPKTMDTINELGQQAVLASFHNEWNEATGIALTIKDQRKKGIKYSDMALIYRTNAQSRVFEDVFLREQIPYDIVSGTSFYKREEIKDMLAYLKLMVNLDDDISIRRMLLRQDGIGKVTISKLAEQAEQNNMSIYEMVKQNNIYRSRKNDINNFIDKIHDLHLYVNTNFTQANNALEYILRNEYIFTIQKKLDTFEAKLENIEELINIANDYVLKNSQSTLASFIEHFILRSDQDTIESTDNVKLMTGHSSKGLEYPVVFIVNTEEEFLPHINCMSDKHQLEEERRLFFVMITRAEKLLYITYSRSRKTNKGEMPRKRSRFIDNIPTNLLNIKNYK